MSRAGRYDRYGVIEEKTTVQDEVGHPVAVWTAWHPAFFAKRDTRGEERLQAAQDLATETTVWETYWVDGLRADIHRLNIEEKIYNIVGIAELGRKVAVEITSKAVRV